MKRIIAIVVIIVTSFNAKAAAVDIVNLTGMPITGYFGGVNLLNGTGPAGASLLGGPVVTIPTLGINFADMPTFLDWSIGPGAGLPYTAPVWRLILTGFNPVGSNCGFFTQNNGTWNIPCAFVPPGFTGLSVNQTITATVTTITISLY